MKCLKEPLSRLANHEEQTRGAFFEGRFKSVAILDEASLLATCAYIDLNPVAAGIAEVPEASAHTSIKGRKGSGSQFRIRKGVQSVSDATCVCSFFLSTAVTIQAYRDDPGTPQ